MVGKNAETFAAEELGASPLYVAEVVNGLNRVNYGQKTSEMNAFAGSVSLAGGSIAGHLYSVMGGNRQIAEGLIRKYADQVFLEHEIVSMSQTSSGGWNLEHINWAAGNETETVSFDKVAFASPIFQGLDVAVVAGLPVDRLPKLKAHTTHVTYVESDGLSSKAFKAPVAPVKVRSPTPHDWEAWGEVAYMPALVLTYGSDEIPFSSVGYVGTNSNGKAVYKVFSNSVLKEDVVEKYFCNENRVQRFSWRAYPELAPLNDDIPFEIAPGVFYVNALEFAASTIETAFVSARNAVRLMVNNENETTRKDEL
eukprot:Trichotokara_eunicae@DN759_c0_g1_i1.p1